MVLAFRGRGMRLHLGGERVVAHARASLRGQVIGTGIRHDLLASPVFRIAVRVVETSFWTALMTRLRLAHRIPLARFAAIDLSAIRRLAQVEDLQTPGAANLHQNLDHFHASTTTAACMKTCRAWTPSGTFAQSASTRDTKAQGD
jgi:hypothetical protein